MVVTQIAYLDLRDGMVRNNCLNNTFELAEHLSSKGVDKQYPLYIASSWEEASGEIVEQVNEQVPVNYVYLRNTK